MSKPGDWERFIGYCHAITHLFGDANKSAVVIHAAENRARGENRPVHETDLDHVLNEQGYTLKLREAVRG
jgi:hypothetical protein